MGKFEGWLRLGCGSHSKVIPYVVLLKYQEGGGDPTPYPSTSWSNKET